MNCLVTGGAGFIGSWLVDSLIDRGYKVAIVDDLSTGKEENINPKAHFYKLKIEAPKLKEVFAKEKPDYVFHLAAQAQVSLSVANPELDAKTNILGTLNILKSCVEHKVKKIIFSSSGGVMYGNVDIPATEKNVANPPSPYGISKLAGEKYIEFYSTARGATSFGLNYLILRYANVYGPRQDPNGEAGVVAIFSKHMLKNEPCILYGFGKLLRDYVYVKDVIEANILGIFKDGNEIINIGTGIPTSVNELFDLMKEPIGYSREPIYKPRRDGEIDKNFLNSNKAREILGWTSKIPLTIGLKETIEWFRKK